MNNNNNSEWSETGIEGHPLHKDELPQGTPPGTAKTVVSPVIPDVEDEDESQVVYEQSAPDAPMPTTFAEALVELKRAEAVFERAAGEIPRRAFDRSPIYAAKIEARKRAYDRVLAVRKFMFEIQQGLPIIHMDANDFARIEAGRAKVHVAVADRLKSLASKNPTVANMLSKLPGK